MTYGIVIVGQRPDQEHNYIKLANANVGLALRSTGWGFTDQLARWERLGAYYLLTAASSDFVAYQDKPLYQDDDHLALMLARPRCIGLYVHELVAYYARLRRWDWTKAVADVEWARLAKWAGWAARAGKPIAWSEPAGGWAAIGQREPIMSNVWPMFATNFVSATAGDHLDEALAGAEALAARTGTLLGESVQSWHFRDQGLAPTADATFDLCYIGLAAGARLFQIEGRPDDLGIDSPYMQGVARFAASLNTEEAAA